MPAALGKSFKDLTEYDITLLARSDLTNAEIAKQIGIHYPSATISRWRKQLGIVIKCGSKSGKPRPWQERNELRQCPTCKNQFVVVPSSPKIWCSNSCWASQRDTAYMQTEEYRSKMRSDKTQSYKAYYGRVYRLTEKVYAEHKNIINPYNYPRGICGKDGVWQLDHIIPVKYGFDNNIAPEIIASLDNLQMLSWEDNLKKGCEIYNGN